MIYAEHASTRIIIKSNSYTCFLTTCSYFAVTYYGLPCVVLGRAVA